MPISKAMQGCRRRVRGASRLEFAMAVVVIGVLIGLLVPRLMEMHGAARPARLQATAAAVRAAAAVFHGRCEALRAHGEADCTAVEIDGRQVAGADAWPAASAEGIVRAAALPVTAEAGTEAFVLRPAQVDGLPALRIALPAPHCEFVYVQADGPGGVPRVDIVDASCQ
jgi:hypothetical protein